MNKYAKKFTYTKKKGLVCCLILVILGGLFLPAANVTAEDEPYLLNFDLEIENTLYVFLNPYFNPNWNNGFLIDYVLDYNGVQIVKSISYSEDGYKETASFENIEVPFDEVDVKYYTDNNVLVDNSHLQYHLELREEPDLDKMVLFVPHFCSVGDEKILQVVDGIENPLETIIADEVASSSQGQGSASDVNTGTVSLSKEGSVENSEADETPEDELAVPDASVEDKIDQPFAEEDTSNTEEQAPNDNNTDLAELGNEELPEAMADENAVPENSPVVPELENTLLIAQQASSLEPPSSPEYELTFNLLRPGPSDNILENLTASYYDHNIDLQDHDRGALKDFHVDFNLYINNSQSPTIVKRMDYSDTDYYRWSPYPITFGNIKIPYQQVDIEYYPEAGGYVEPYLFSYDLYLDASPAEGKMILRLPRLEPSRHEYEEMPKVTIKSPIPQNPLYLGGDNSSDNNDGFSADTPLASFEAAKGIVLEDKKIKKIIVNGTIKIKDDISLSGSRAVLQRGPDFNGYLLEVEAGNEASLSNIVVDGTCVRIATDTYDGNNNIKCSLIKVNPNATLNVGPGTELINNRMLSKKDSTKGGAIEAQNAKVNVTGGNIQHNQAKYGGGIYANSSVINMTGGLIKQNLAAFGGGICLDNGSRMTFSNGTIESNKTSSSTYESNNPSLLTYININNDSDSEAEGGGILAVNGSTIDMSDTALIKNNVSSERGGGISVGDNKSGRPNTLTMRGGVIDNNRAGTGGGGIFIQAGYEMEPSKAIISGGKIINNKMYSEDHSVTPREFGGGGIYVNGYTGQRNGELYLYNAIIIDNGSDDFGAGYASCPCSKTKVYVTNGCAIYTNKLKSGHKDDIHILCNDYGGTYGPHYGKPEYELSTRMLGGVLNNWRLLDGTLLDRKLYKGQLTIDGTALDLYTDQSGNKLTTKLGHVLISGNYSATKGGGIGSNGTVIFGEEGTTEVSVTKQWNDNDNAESTRPDSITVNLLVEVDGQNYVMDSAVLNEANNWAYTFKDLPTKNGDEPFVYSIEEVSVAGYTGEISGGQETGFIITNSIPREPTQPTEPTESEPSTPPPPSVTVSSPIVFKKITGGQPESADLFTFRIEPVSYKPDQTYPRTEPNSLPLPQGEQGAVQEVQISGEGTASTGQITYKQPGYYEYQIRELATGDGKYIYSTDVYTFVDHVYMQDGQLVVDRTMYKNGQKANTTTAYFTNQYQGEPGPQEKVTSLPATGELTHLGLDLTLLSIGVLTLIQKKHGR